MSDVKVELKPTDQLIALAQMEKKVTDARGRVIVLKKPGPLAQYRLVSMMGNEDAANQTLMRMTLPLIHVVSIDDDPVTLTTRRHIDALIQRLDESGIEAVMNAVYADISEQTAEQEAAETKN